MLVGSASTAASSDLVNTLGILHQSKITMPMATRQPISCLAPPPTFSPASRLIS